VQVVIPRFNSRLESNSSSYYRGLCWSEGFIIVGVSVSRNRGGYYRSVGSQLLHVTGAQLIRGLIVLRIALNSWIYR